MTNAMSSTAQPNELGNATTTSHSNNAVDTPVQQQQEQPPPPPPQLNTSTTNQRPINPCWTRVTEGYLHQWILRGVLYWSTLAARRPKQCISLVMVMAFAVIVTGLFTNFSMLLDPGIILTPSNSLVAQHATWIPQDSGFPIVQSWNILLHDDGNNVLTAQGLHQLMQTVQVVLTTPGYNELCNNNNNNNNNKCRLTSATQFWNHNSTLLQQELNMFATPQEQDDYIQRVVSNNTFPDGGPVFHGILFGNYETTTTIMDIDVFDSNHTTTDTTTPFAIPTSLPPGKHITSAQSLLLTLQLPNDDENNSNNLQTPLLQRLEQLQDDYQQPSQESYYYSLEYFALSAYNDEMTRAVFADIPLVVSVFWIMVIFCCLVFYRRHEQVNSRALVGVYSILTIFMSLLTAYGILFIAGVPFTNICMMVPFVVVGIGLDDTFIICSAYFRRSQQPTSDDAEIVQRVRDTMHEVGLSITLTTVTTTLAFLLGILSSIPAIRWMCLYAFLTVMIDFVYQITFFVAWLALDERRIRARRKDVCVWITVVEEEEVEHDQLPLEEEHAVEEKKELSLTSESSSAAASSELEPSRDKGNGTAAPNSSNDRHFSERFMARYADVLLQPWVQAAVIIGSLIYFGGCVYSTTLMTQEFLVPDYVPKDSYVVSHYSAFQAYTSLVAPIAVYFRNVDQSSPTVQQQMLDYVEQLTEMPQIAGQPPTFWVRDFAALGASAMSQDMNVGNLSFVEQIDLALSIPEVQEAFGGDIVRDPTTGEITASRTWLYLREIDMDVVQEQVDLLLDQREISFAQSINRDDGGQMNFFTFEDVYNYWELYAATFPELISSTVSGVVAVTFVAFFMIPSWTAILFCFPLIVMLYINLLGTLQYCGIHINPITYVLLVISIGLLVDFLMHILLRFYEIKGTNRREKVKLTLESMGSSILLGGVSTLLGVAPLAFSTTKVFSSVFVVFSAMVTLGCGMGLILLPVLLSLIGPTGTPEQDSPDVRLQSCLVIQNTDTPTGSVGTPPKCFSFDRYHQALEDEVAEEVVA